MPMNTQLGNIITNAVIDTGEKFPRAIFAGEWDVKVWLWFNNHISSGVYVAYGERLREFNTQLEEIL